MNEKDNGKMGQYNSGKCICISIFVVPSYFSEKKSLPNFACALFYSEKHNGRPVILSAGGRSSRYGGASAEILDLKTKTWESSKFLIH